ncbi:ankyrin repeat domain-containing protein [Cellulophaga baltica]|uniref:ankyrin repeat domain-containing protein n=1 Tax=Cellulophaga TaxID=104264 RepID=UPI001C0779FB|nr:MULTISPECIES: ankyrin repeat domain-containing protein [Cellulophaga]MBU2995285.1 ankyrin repeat domain-containing protein [Cellulophaga baltica]MDO6766680.1 ankyrin repeat domain-containing protein [Cellulophaga sp. 1_MG-2023]
MKKTLFILFISIFSAQLSAQGHGPAKTEENVFLNREFWGSKPTIKLIEEKINEGNDIAGKTSSNFDPVVYAILQQADNSVIKYIQSKEGNDANKLTHDGRTYLFWAAYKGNVEIMKYLVSKGAKMDITDDKGSTVLNFAAAAGEQNTAVYDFCIANGADLKKDLTPYGANALLLGIQKDKNFKLTDYFVSKGLSINSVDAKGNDAFNYVAKTGNIEALKALREKGVNGNDNAFMFATQGGRRAKLKPLEFYKFLESLGLNPNVIDSEGKTPLHNLASYATDKEVFNYFINKGVDVNLADQEGNTAFLNAVNRNEVETIEFFLPKIKDINLKNKKGETALAIATENNSPKVVAFLLQNKASIKTIDNEGNNLAYYLLKSYSPKSKTDFDAKLKLLTEEGLDITAPQKNGNTLYHLALANNDVKLLEVVKQYNIDVNAKNNDGVAPIHVAAMRAKDDKALKYLLSIGAKKDATTDFDESVYDLASENELLQEKNISIEFLK